ncbi:MAG: type II secretion system F family protein [Candidatus Glassbacteria bacterium]|nr:type II secretion system F family protein [Candidatus Glassbacteria bacterium]
MAFYQYKASDEQGKTVKGVMEAEDEGALEDLLESRRLYLISSNVSGKKGSAPGARAGTTGGKRVVRAKVKRADLISFTVHLSTVIGAGVPILQGLDDMVEETENPRFAQVIRGIRQSIQDGSSISDSFAQYPEVFSELYVAILRSGETTGRMDEVLKEIVSFLEWQDELVGTIKQATTYPVIVLIAVMGLIAIMFTFVLPRFLGIFDTFDIELPLPTRIVIAISDFFQNFWWLMIVGIIAAVVGLRAANKTPGGRLVLDKIKLNIPVFGELVRKVALSRFAHYLATLFGAGVNILNALEVVERVVGNAVLAEVVRKARLQVGTGHTISGALKESKEFPSMVVRMVTIGETTGNLEETLGKVSEYYDREVPITVKRLFTALEGAIIIFLGAIILFVVLSILLPMLSLQQVGH